MLNWSQNLKLEDFHQHYVSVSKDWKPKEKNSGIILDISYNFTDEQWYWSDGEKLDAYLWRDYYPQLRDLCKLTIKG